MILTSALACAVTVYRESRGTYLSEQILVAKVIRNRAVEQNITLVDTIYRSGQFNALSGFKKHARFKDYKELLSYYRIDDMESLAMANLACEFSKQSDTKYTYFTDKSIPVPSWAKKMHKVTTKHFNFYEVRE